MAKFLKPTIFETGRTREGTYSVGVIISDQLLIEACEHGSGGVGRWRTTVANRVVRKATLMAAKEATGDPLDHYDHWQGYTPGCYRDGFSVHKWGGGAGHIRRAVVFNRCPHALFVEAGRDPSYAYEVFTTRASVLHANYGGKGRRKSKSNFLIVRRPPKGGTIRKTPPKRVLTKAWAEVLATTNTFNMRGRNLSALASFTRATQ